MFYLYLWKMFVKVQFKSITTYKLDFYFGAISLLFLDLPILVLISIVFSHISQLYIWSYYDMLLLNGILMVISSLADCFEGHVRNIGELVSSGEFDNYLIRPVKPSFLLIFTNMQIEAIFSFIFGVVLSVISIINIPQLHDVGMILLLIVHIIIGVLLTSQVIFALSCIPFWFIGIRGLWNIINYGYEYSHYPLDIFPNPIKFILKWIIPIGTVGPVTIFVFVNGNKIQCLKTIGVEILMCIIWLLIDVFIWEKGLKKYQSAGS